MESYSNMSSIPHRLDQLQSHVKVRSQQYRSENSPNGYQDEINTPGFYQDNTDHKYHQSNQSIKEFSLGKPNRFRSTYKKSNPSFRQEESREAVSNKENANIDKYMQDLKRIKREYTKVMETDQAEKARFQQQEFISANEDITLLLNEDTRINNSFINESQHKILNHNTPSKTPARTVLGSKSGNKLKKDDSMCLLTNSHMSASIDRNEKTNEKMNESLFLKSHEFPKLLKRKTTRPYTKVLIPFLLTEDDPKDQPADLDTILDLYRITKRLKLDEEIEHFEGVCLIKNLKRPVLIKRSQDQNQIMKEIMTQLVFYENEVNFKHCSILKMKDFFNVKGFYYVIYDKPGDALGYLDSGTSLNEGHVYQMAYSLFSALNLMHSLNIVHSKLNLESIYFTYENTMESLRLTVGDFERCYFEHDKAHKPWFDSFSAPEMIFDGLTEKRSDYWSFACVVFFLTTGKHLFPTNSKAGLAYMV